MDSLENPTDVKGDAGEREVSQSDPGRLKEMKIGLPKVGLRRKRRT